MTIDVTSSEFIGKITTNYEMASNCLENNEKRLKKTREIGKQCSTGI